MKNLSTSDTHIVESNELTSVKKYINPHKKTVAVFDIDNTLTTAPDILGTPEWFIWQLQTYKKEGLPSLEALNKALHLHNHILKRTWLQAAPNASKIIQHLHNNGIPTIALTARNLVGRTIEQLAAADIRLGHPKLPQHFFELATDNPQRPVAGYKNGIIFCNGNNKGTLLLRFLQETTYSPNAIIFVDDMLEHVHAVTKTMEKHNLSCTGIRYTYFDAKTRTFNTQQARRELQAFLRKHPLPQGPTPSLADKLCM